MSHECPICYFVGHSPHNVLNHFIGRHKKELRGLKAYREEGERVHVVHCFCGGCYTHAKTDNQWERHLDANGGLTAHMLSCLLSVEYKTHS